jgi:hypothetical protein
MALLLNKNAFNAVLEPCFLDRFSKKSVFRSDILPSVPRGTISGLLKRTDHRGHREHRGGWPVKTKKPSLRYAVYKNATEHLLFPPCSLCPLTRSLPLSSPSGPTFGCSISKAPPFRLWSIPYRPRPPEFTSRCRSAASLHRERCLPMSPSLNSARRVAWESSNRSPHSP